MTEDGAGAYLTTGVDVPPEEGEWVDLAAARFGGTVVYANDEFFGSAGTMLVAGPPVHQPGVYTDRGSWMDGWETRRRRVPGCDHAVIRLGARGVVESVVVDTSFFTGNAPESVELHGAALPGYPGPAEVASPDVEWVPLVSRTEIKADAVNVLPAESSWRVSHVRLTIHPDGGVARLRIRGHALSDPREVDRLVTVDLAAAEHGGAVVAASDMHYGDRRNLVAPGESRVMGEGWETRRRRGGGNDWAVVRLAAAGTVLRADVDTRHFKGNAPGACLLSGVVVPPGGTVPDDLAAWTPLLPRTPLQPDTVHRFAVAPAEATHVRVDVLPDGGLARLRLWGTVTPGGREALAMRWFDALPPAMAVGELLTCCASPPWAEAVAAARPAGDLATLLALAAREWERLSPADRLAAFAAHPRIGERGASPVTRAEQAAALDADADVLAALAAGNERYEERFGMVYLVRAAGRGAAEMLALLEQRLGNTPADELVVAAGQQAEITALRLRKLIAG